MFKEYIEGKKAVCFDLDGTIIDSLPWWEKAVREVFKKLDPQISPDLISIYKGVSLSDIYKENLAIYKIKTTATVAQLVAETHTQFLKTIQAAEEIETRDGFWELASELKIDKKLKLGLTSNTERQIVEALKHKADLDNVFDTEIAGDEVKNKKPHPDIYLKASKNLKVSPQELLVFEDSVAGAQAANKCGADLIIIWNADVPQKEYPKGVFTFMPNFDGLAGNLDLNYVDYIKKLAEEPDPYRKPLKE